MSLKRFGLSLAAVMILGAVLASSAFATAETKPSRWYVNGVGLNAAQKANVTCKGTERVGQVAGEGNLKLVSKVLGEEFVITGTGIECLPHVTTETNARIEQTGEGTVANPYVAEDFGKFKFTGLTVSKPAGCKVPTSITTEALKSEIYMEGTNVYDKFVPTGEFFAKVPITGCAIESTPKVTGSSFALAQHVNAEGKTVNNLTGEEFVSQMLTSSAAIETAAGGTLKLGPEPATLSATVDNELTSGLKFGAKEN
jgi:hypothetical protein